MRLLPPEPPAALDSKAGEPPVGETPEPRPAPSRDAQVWLLRHGAVEEASAGLAYGDRDVPLSAEGERQTIALASSIAALPVARVAGSPLQRAWRLGQACAARHELEPARDERLRELDRGSWQDLPVDDYRARWSADAPAFWRDPWRWRGHGGESDEQLAARAWPALLEQLDAAAGGLLVLATHRNIIRVLVACALGLPAARSHALLVDPAHGVLLRTTSRGWMLERSNVAAPGQH